MTDQKDQNALLHAPTSASGLTRLEAYSKRVSAQGDALLSALEELHELMEKTEEDNASEEQKPKFLNKQMRTVHKQMKTVVSLLGEFANLNIEEQQLHLELRTSQVATIKKHSFRRTHVSEECVREVWNEIEKNHGQVYATITTQDGQIRTVKLLSDLFQEKNSKDRRITVLTIYNRDDSTGSCRVIWRSQRKDPYGTCFHLFGDRTAVEQKEEALEGILSKYEDQSQETAWMGLAGRILIPLFWAIVVYLVMLSVLPDTAHWFIRTLCTSAVTLFVFWSGLNIADRIDGRVDIAIGAGKGRRQRHAFARKTILVASITALIGIAIRSGVGI